MEILKIILYTQFNQSSYQIRTNKKNFKFFFNLFSPDLSFRLKEENLKGLAIVAFYIIGKYNFPII